VPSILAYVHAYVPTHNAGAETTLHDILRYLVSQGWEATVVLKPETNMLMPKEDPKEVFFEGVRVVTLSRPNQLVSYVANADVTISHLECSNRLHLLSKKWNKPTVHLVHNTHKLTRQWASGADALIFNTNWVSEDPMFSDFTHPWMACYPPVNPENYKVTRGKSVTLVNLWPDKGSGIFYYLAEQFPEIPFLGVIGGYGEQVIKELPNVTILPHTPDMKSVYSKTKILLMPSKYESYGRVGVEAMASGIPVLAHPTSGLRESLGDAGTFADRDTPEDWKKSLTELLKPAKYGKMSKLATARSEILHRQSSMELESIPSFLKELIRIKNGRRV
jgi:hypothetical protein